MADTLPPLLAASAASASNPLSALLVAAATFEAVKTIRLPVLASVMTEICCPVMGSILDSSADELLLRVPTDAEVLTDGAEAGRLVTGVAGLSNMGAGARACFGRGMADGSTRTGATMGRMRGGTTLGAPTHAARGAGGCGVEGWLVCRVVGVLVERMAGGCQGAVLVAAGAAVAQLGSLSGDCTAGPVGRMDGGCHGAAAVLMVSGDWDFGADGRAGRVAGAAAEAARRSLALPLTKISSTPGRAAADAEAPDSTSAAVARRVVDAANRRIGGTSLSALTVLIAVTTRRLNLSRVECRGPTWVAAWHSTVS